MEKVTVIGAGLAGSEAAWQLAEMGVPVKLAEMRPAIGTPAHHTGYCAELVCSNSFRAAALTNAVGLLKEEMRRLGSVIMECADAHRVPAGGALAVDRNGYAAAVTKKIKSHPLIEFVNEEIREIPEEGIVIIATGPLTDGALAKSIEKFCGGEGLHFYDAAAPIVMKESLDMDIVYRMSRYNKGEAAYLNCPMNEEEYNAFYEALRTAETAEVHGFEEGNVFEGCMPVEVMAQRGKDTMRFGPMKPVGLPDPRTGKEPYAVHRIFFIILTQLDNGIGIFPRSGIGKPNRFQGTKSHGILAANGHFFNRHAAFKDHPMFKVLYVGHFGCAQSFPKTQVFLFVQRAVVIGGLPFSITGCLIGNLLVDGFQGHNRRGCVKEMEIVLGNKILDCAR